MSLDWSHCAQPCELVDSQSFTGLDPTFAQCPRSGMLDTSDALDASFTPFEFLTTWCTCNNPYYMSCSEHEFENHIQSNMDHLDLDPFKFDFSSSRPNHADRVDTAGPMHDQQTTDASVELPDWVDVSESERPTIEDAIDIRTRPRRPEKIGTRAHRSNISAEAKSILQTHFARDPYPSIEDLDLLARKTSLPLKTVRTWFNNVRSREKMSDLAQNGSHGHTATIEKATLISTRSVSESTLELLNRLSPKSSNSSLERFLTAPAEDESVAISAVKSALLEPYVPGNGVGASLYSLPTWGGTSSVVGSESSWSSANSAQSWNSQMSSDSRGSRRGRKRWTRAQSSLLERKKGQNVTKPRKDNIIPLPARAARNNDLGSSHHPHRALLPPASSLQADIASSQELFCTWPTCETTFQSRFDWDRHETAVHHCPFQWVCNMSECRGNKDLSWCHSCKRVSLALHQRRCDCGQSEAPSRIFFRKDQLGQHMKRVHFGQDKPSADVFNDILLACKIENPSKSASLHCGFCGMSLLTWKTRQDHVFTHMRNGACKSSWWPERLGERFEARAEGFTCPACGSCFESFSAAMREHPYCFTWSCRYFHNASESIAAKSEIIDGLSVVDTKCRLCAERFGTRAMGLEDLFQRIGEHIDGHTLRGCSQEIFTDQNTFATHLQSEHGAGFVVGEEGYLKHWQRIQFLEIIEGRGMIRTSRPYADVDCCKSKGAKYSFAFIDV